MLSLVLLLSAVVSTGNTAVDLGEIDDIEQLDLESLLGTVTAASRTEESRLKAPATVTVLDREQIRLSGARTIPDLQLFFVVAMVDDHARKLHLGHGFSCHVCVLRPKSRGTRRPMQSRRSCRLLLPA